MTNFAKRCSIRITRHYGGRFDTRETGPYRSVRHARRCMLDVGRYMDRLSRSMYYSIEIVTSEGCVIPVRDSVVEWVQSESFYDQWYNSIGARLDRGEVVAV